jgi:NAD(P)-dependent dehydrogenase (short-subunit alcohol dehydrogenase family)
MIITVHLDRPPVKVYGEHYKDVQRTPWLRNREQNMSAKRSVVITGASTGIGWAAARVLLGKGFHVFGTVRKQSDADRLLAEFGSNFVPLLADVTDEAAVRQAAATVADMLGSARLAGLVNNAGIVVAGTMLHLEPSEVRRQMEVNLIGAFIVTQAFAPLLGTDPARTGQAGRIVQISSVSGTMGVPFVGAYSASKFALEGMSESLRRELMLYGIDVIVVGPGPVITPIWQKGEEADYSRYDATDYGPVIERFRAFFAEESKKGLPAEKLGQVIHHVLTVPRPKVRYAVVPNRLKDWTIPRLLPKRLLDRIMAKQLGMVKK